jgi:hypothetical protein
MPTISMFFGIMIRMYLGAKEHSPPHIHVYYQDDLASFDIRTGERIHGNLPVKQMKLVSAWIEIHRDELLADWTLAQSGEELFKIDPLK